MKIPKIGDLYEVPLNKKYGFGYGIYFLVDDGGKWSKHYFKLLSYRREEMIDKKDISELYPIEFNLMSPIILQTKPKRRGRDKWRQIQSELEIDMGEVAHTKWGTNLPIVPKEGDISKYNWKLIQGFIAGKCRGMDYEKMEHLSFFGSLGQSLATNIITMSHLRLNGEDIEDWYKEDIEKNYFIKNEYHKILRLPLYKDIPLEWRDRIKE